jgi:hypothetical protein
VAEALEKVGFIKEGLDVLAQALAGVDKTGERFYEAELWRLRGELTLQQANQKTKGKIQKTQIPSPESLTPNTQAAVEQEAEGYFLKAIDIARQQQAKSFELRAVTSLVRQRQSTQVVSRNTSHATRHTQHDSRTMLVEAHTMLSDIYNWFTEGFGTKDLQDAKTLLDSL